MMNKSINFIKQHTSIILYIILGGFTTAINLACYMLSVYIGIDEVLATIIAWLVSVLFSFLTNRRIVFKSETNTFVGTIKELANFMSCRIASGVFDLVVIIVFVKCLNFQDKIVKIASNIVVIILNYLLSKYWVFKK